MDSRAFTELCWASHSLYPEFVAEIEEVSGVKTGYRRDGTLLLAIDEEQAGEMDQIQATPDYPKASAAADIQRLSTAAVRQYARGSTDRFLSALFLAADHWIDNERLTRATITSAQRFNVTFSTPKAVERFVIADGRVQAIEAGGERFSASEFILAAGAWSGALARSAGLEIPTVPCRGQMIEFELDSELKMVLRAGHHYLVPRANGRVVAGTTAEYTGFEKSVTASGLASVLEGTLRLAPFLAAARFVRAWAGLRPDTPDHLPVLGPSGTKGLTVATGHFRNGILLAPITARLIADCVLNASAPEALQPFAADRFSREAEVQGAST
jgi:glycine oxidase